jgi:hypothetical protein
VTVESKLGLLRKVDQNRLDADLDRIFLIVKIAAAMEIVLVDDRPPIKALRPQNEVKGLAHGRFPDVVSTDQKCVSCQVHDAVGHTSEIRDSQTPYFHSPSPPAGPILELPWLWHHCCRHTPTSVTRID